MAGRLTKDAYRQFVEEDIVCLKRWMPDTLERRHIIDIMRESVDAFYPPEGYLPPGARPVSPPA